MAQWHTTQSLRGQWSNAPKDEELLVEILAVAKSQVIEFAPVLAEGDPVPDNYRYGQMLQARAIWESMRANVGSDVDGATGLEGYQIRATDMSPTIQRVLRPKAGVPRIG